MREGVSRRPERDETTASRGFIESVDILIYKADVIFIVLLFSYYRQSVNTKILLYVMRIIEMRRKIYVHICFSAEWRKPVYRILKNSVSYT